MPNDFIGELSKARLFDLVGPLLTGKKSGMVLIKGHDSGELHIEGGNIIHAKTGYSSGEEAILAMMEWDTGRVTFDWEVTTEERTVYMPTEQLFQSWSNREEEWRKIREIVSSSNLSFRIPVESSPEDRNIQGDQWKVLALSNGGKTVAEIAESLKWNIFKTSKIVYQMVQTGFLEKASEKAPEQKSLSVRYVNGNFFPMIENELKKVMGPIAPIIVDDKIADFGESRDAFPEERVQPFVQAIGEEIQDNSKRALFTKIVTEFLAQKQH
jgi:hypothetical protein